MLLRGRMLRASLRRQSTVSSRVLELGLTSLAERLVQLNFEGVVQIILFLFNVVRLVQLYWLSILMIFC